MMQMGKGAGSYSSSRSNGLEMGKGAGSRFKPFKIGLDW